MSRLILCCRVVVLVAVACLLGFSSSPTLLAAERSNIVVIMADDMGYTDIGCYGGEIATPTLDRLAANGLRFTQFYNTSRCCPTRAALLTGLYSHQAGIGLMTSDRGVDAYRGQLNDRCVTLAEVLGDAGYRTYMSGKWHVTRNIRPDSDQSCWPLQRGFDRFYGTIIGAGSFYDPTTLCRGNTFITPENDPRYQPELFYYSDAISDNAAAYVRDHSESGADEPFFMYVAYTSAHWPMHAPEEDVEPYIGKYDVGYEAIRQKRYAKAIETGVIDSRWPMDGDRFEWSKARNREWETRCMEVYAGMVTNMDRGIGRIVDELERTGQLDNTLVVYLQDNGGCAEGFGRRDNSNQEADFDFKPFTPDDLQPKIWPPMQTRDGRWVRTGPNAMPGPEDTYVGYGAAWAAVSNTPFRGYKHDPYEGGTSTPFIVHWPAGTTPSRHGGVVDDSGHLIDLMPTCVDVAKAEYPSKREGQGIQPMEGVSLVPAIEGAGLDRDAPLFFEHHGNLGMRDGRWKIVSIYRANQPRRWELYDIETDRTEQVDLSETMPDRLNEMVAEWDAWAERVGVEPWPFKKAGK